MAPAASGCLGDLCQKTYQPACLFVRLRRCGNRYIVRLCAYGHALKTNDNPAQSGMLFSANRLRYGTLANRPGVRQDTYPPSSSKPLLVIQLI
jgi:hypothetical protein